MSLLGSRMLTLGAILVGATGCQSDNVTRGGFCAAPYFPAVEAAVRDSLTGAAIADSAIGTLRFQADTFDQPMVHWGTGDSVLAGGYPPGSYLVTLTRPSYQSWQRSVSVGGSNRPCGGPATVHLTARLVPAP